MGTSKMKLFISAVACFAVASAMPQVDMNPPKLDMVQNSKLQQASEKIKGKLEAFFQPYVNDYQQAAEDVKNDMVQIYENDQSTASKAQSIVDLMQEKLDENNVNVNLAAHQSNANSQINAQVNDITSLAEDNFGGYVQQAKELSKNTLGGLLSKGFDSLKSQISNGVANNDLQNALNSLSGSLQDSANQALGGNSDLSLKSIAQQVGSKVLSEANKKYDLQNKIDKVQAELEN